MARVHMTVDPFDLRSLFSLRRIVHDLERARTPVIRTVAPVPRARAVALLPGSFNPPTAAHLLLAERALSEGFDVAVFTLAVRTAGKQRSGMILEDRLLALRAMCASGCVVGLSSHGLYADQAEAAAAVFGDAELAFLVGSDKVIQIFDPRWYGDRNAALDRLFSRASLLVAPRWDQADALRDVLDDPANERWTSKITILRLHPAVVDLSSTRVRGLLRAGADPAGLVPTAVADLLRGTRAFASPLVVGSEEVDPYALRARLIDMIWRTHDDEYDIDLARLVTIACSNTEAGRRLRATLRSGLVGEDTLATVRAAAAM